MKQLEKCLKNRQGTTLVEMLVTLNTDHDHGRYGSHHTECGL